MQVAEIVTEVFGKAGLGELYGDDQHAAGVGVRQPVVSVIPAVAGNAVVDEQHGHVRMPVMRARSVEDQQPIREHGIEPGEGGRARGCDQMREIGHGRIVGPGRCRAGDGVGVTMLYRRPAGLDRKNFCLPAG